MAFFAHAKEIDDGAGFTEKEFIFLINDDGTIKVPYIKALFKEPDGDIVLKDGTKFKKFGRNNEIFSGKLKGNKYIFPNITYKLRRLTPKETTQITADEI